MAARTPLHPQCGAGRSAVALCARAHPTRPMRTVATGSQKAATCSCWGHPSLSATRPDGPEWPQGWVVRTKPSARFPRLSWKAPVGRAACPTPSWWPRLGTLGAGVPGLHEGGASSPRSAAPLSRWAAALLWGAGDTHLELVLVGGRFPCAGCPRRTQALLQVMHGDDLAGCEGTAAVLGNKGDVSPRPSLARWSAAAWGSPLGPLPHWPRGPSSSVSLSVRANQPRATGEQRHSRIFLTVMGRL